MIVQKANRINKMETNMKGEEKMKTAKDIALIGSVVLGIHEERMLYLLGDYLRMGDHYLKNPNEELPFQDSDSLGNFFEYVTLIVQDEKKSKTKGREQRLRDTGWIVRASADDRTFVVDNPYGGWQVIHFYQDSSPHGVSMVEGYFADSLAPRAREVLFDDPDEFVKRFYFYCSSVEPDWSTKELNIYNEPKVHAAQ